MAAASAEEQRWRQREGSSEGNEATLLVSGLPPRADHKAVRMLFRSWPSAAVPSVMQVKAHESDSDLSTVAMVEFETADDAEEALRVMDALPLVGSYVLQLQWFGEAQSAASIKCTLPAELEQACMDESAKPMSQHPFCAASFEDALGMFAGRRLLHEMLDGSGQKMHQATGAIVRLRMTHGHACALLLALEECPSGWDRPAVFVTRGDTHERYQLDACSNAVFVYSEWMELHSALQKSNNHPVPSRFMADTVQRNLGRADTYTTQLSMTSKEVQVDFFKHGTADTLRPPPPPPIPNGMPPQQAASRDESRKSMRRDGDENEKDGKRRRSRSRDRSPSKNDTDVYSEQHMTKAPLSIEYRQGADAEDSNESRDKFGRKLTGMIYSSGVYELDDESRERLRKRIDDHVHDRPARKPLPEFWLGPTKDLRYMDGKRHEAIYVGDTWMDTRGLDMGPIRVLRNSKGNNDRVVEVSMKSDTFLGYIIGSNGETLDRVRKNAQPIHLTQQQETLYDTLLVEGPVECVVKALEDLLKLAKEFKRHRGPPR